MTCIWKPLRVLVIALAATSAGAATETTISDVLAPAPSGTVRLGGYLGEKMDLCATHRIWNRGSEDFLLPHKLHNDSTNWRGEYWGKWATAAVLAYAHRPEPAHLRQIETSTLELLTAQHADGYLGPYAATERLQHWDVWCRKYNLLGLLSVHELTGEERYLQAASRNAVQMIDDLRQRTIKVVEVATPVLQGTADSSIIEPIALLYQRTGDPRYLEFAESVLELWKKPFRWAPEGTPMLDMALADKPPFDNHAYGIMSCFEGICELYRGTGNPVYLEAAVRFGQSVRRYERMINGGLSNSERFCDGVRRQTELFEQPQETCATVTWMKLCTQLLRLTGDPVWADELEVSLYNAMLGSLTPNGEWFGYFTALNGERVPSFVPHIDFTMSCCVASGPRGVMLTPRWAIMSAKEGPVINLYGPGTATSTLADGTTVSITQETDYPFGDTVNLGITSDAQHEWTLALRIPAWSTSTTLLLNGVSQEVTAGTYAKISRAWRAGDRVTLRLDLRGHAIPAPSGAPQFAIMRGPIVLALDNRFNETTETLLHLKPDADGFVSLTPSARKPAEVQLAVDVPFEVRPSHFFNHHIVSQVMCDFASAGNGWSEKNLYRVWLPDPLYHGNAFAAGTWKLMPGDGRPPIPPPPVPKPATAPPHP